MGLRIYRTGGNEELLLALPDTATGTIESTQDELERKTGQFVDPYGTTVLEPEHAAIWLQSLQRHISEAAGKPSPLAVLQDLVKLLKFAVGSNVALRVEGD